MSTEAAEPEPEVIGVRRGGAAIAILNRPKALNALNTNMVELLKDLYLKWETDPSINLVIIKSDNRAFCSGGDVKTAVELARQGKPEVGIEFFRKEYELDYISATLKKPIVALINGVVMGGGNGISMHCPFRVVSEKALFAMPETLIGLHPDVGASYFLAHLPGFVGEYLALTGTRLKAPDLAALGLATHIVTSNRLPLLEERLCALRTPDLESINLAIIEHADVAHPSEEVVSHRQEIINKCFQHATMEEIMAALDTEAAGTPPSDPSHPSPNSDAQWCADTLATLKQMSPTSLKVSLRSVRLGRTQTLAEALVKEQRLSARAVEMTTSHDFVEGVRALLIDKDKNPKFSPPTLEAVTSAMVDAHFSPLPNPEWELKLPVAEREPPKPKSRF